MKAQNIPQLIENNRHHCGFAGLDWVEEHQSDVEVLLPLGFNPVQIVAAIPEDSEWDQWRRRHLVVATEYVALTRRFLEKQGCSFTMLRSYGATEVFPPEDADLVVDNTATGQTLKENHLKIVDTLMTSETVFLAGKQALADPDLGPRIHNLVLVFRSILEASKRVLLEMNCPIECLDTLVAALPAMKAPSVSRLFGQEGFAVKAAVPKRDVPALIPRLKQAGATDILELAMRKVVP
jgi:ATP phosphoribosyltransferase